MHEDNPSLKELKNNNTFKSNLKIDKELKIAKLEYKLKRKEITISDLSDEELNDMINFYKIKIEAKKNTLKSYRSYFQ